MTAILVVGVPVALILIIALVLKLKTPFNYILIVVLSVCSTYAVDFVFCSLLENKCEPDALNAVAFLTHPWLVIVISSISYKAVCEKCFIE